MKVVKHWDTLPPVVESQGEFFSTRVLERNYQLMEDTLKDIAKSGYTSTACQKLAADVLEEIK